jgi:hypothetical protein
LQLDRELRIIAKLPEGQKLSEEDMVSPTLTTIFKRGVETMLVNVAATTKGDDNENGDNREQRSQSQSVIDLLPKLDDEMNKKFEFTSTLLAQVMQIFEEARSNSAATLSYFQSLPGNGDCTSEQASTESVIQTGRLVSNLRAV